MTIVIDPAERRRQFIAFLDAYDTMALRSATDNAVAMLVQCELERLQQHPAGPLNIGTVMKEQAGASITAMAREDYNRVRNQLDELQRAALALVEKSKAVAQNVTMLEGSALDELRHVLIRQGVKVSASPS